MNEAPPRGACRLRILLGELRQGADIESAAVVADIPLPAARMYLEEQEAGNYTDIVATTPAWTIEGDATTIALAGGNAA